MSYTGIHRKSLLGAIGGWISGIVELAIVFWLTFEGLHQSREAPNFLLFEAGLLGSLIVAVVIHESGHLLVGLAAGEPVRMLRIGSGPTVFGFRVAGLAVQVGLNLLGGGAVGFSVAEGAPGFKRLASLIAGPFVNLLAGCYAAFLYQYTGEGWLGVFALANAICFISSAIPSTSTVGGVAHPSDGMQVIRVLFKPEATAAMPNFMASAMTDEALKVMVRAAEDAVLSGAAEVTDWGLLRGLARDQAVGELFASVRLDAKIPPPPTAESTQMQRPTFSPVADAVLAVAFKEGRAMGVDRPNPACICLGLLLTDCPAGRLMKEAGITEDAVREVASVAAKENDDVRRAQVLSPDLPLERWGTAAEKALAYAFRVAEADGSRLVGTQHLVAALVADPQCRAAQALARTGFALEWKPSQSRDPEFEEDPGFGQVMSPELGFAVAGGLWRTGPTFPTGTAELCLGIVDQSAGEGAQILLLADVSVDGLESALRSTAREPSYPAGCSATSRGMWMLRGTARMEAQRWLDAHADFAEAERAAVNDQQRAVCRNNMAWASLMSGETALRAESLELARFAISIKPNEPSFIGTLAFALLENGSPAEAAAMLESSLPSVTRPKNRAFNLCELAICYARMNEPDAALKNLAAAAEADSECPLMARTKAELGAVAA